MSIRASILEIRHSVALRVFGALLAVSHVITFYSWWHDKSLPGLLGHRPATAVCWPFFEDCWRLHPISESLIHAALITYVVIAVIGVGLFASRRLVAWAYAALCSMTAIKLAIFVLDYRLMGNYHYMPFVVSFAYLFCRDKTLVCRYLIIGFYISAGTLKLNWEWLSGAALLRPPLLTGWLGDLSLAYVVMLELVFVFGLLAKNRYILFGTLAQFLIFHIYSWHIVGYFYPCIMFCLLAIFPLCYFTRDDGPRRLSRSGKVALAIYVVAQLAPALFPGDSALSGEGRIFALNMLDAKSECSLSMITTQGNVHTERATLSPGLGVRIRCEPLVYYNVAKGMCRELDGNLDLGLVARRTTDTRFRSLVSVPDFCSKELDYDLWHHNTWMDP